MLHAKRVWCIAEAASAAELAEKLTQMTWCCCQAFQIAGHPQYIWLNDSTSEDGAQEYAVLKRNDCSGRLVQIESIAFSWCDYERALEFIQATLNGEDDNNEWARPVTATIQTPEEHGRCGLCA